jgi:hypothetical protein
VAAPLALPQRTRVPSSQPVPLLVGRIEEQDYCRRPNRSDNSLFHLDKQHKTTSSKQLRSTYQDCKLYTVKKVLKHLDLAHKFLQKQQNITRMEDDVDYVPVSARVSFKVQTWKEAEDSTEYTALITETNSLVTTFLLQLKEQILKNMVLEHESIREIMHNELCASILAIAELHLEALNKAPQLAPEMALAILQTGGNAILHHIPSATLEDFTILFRTVNSTPPDSQATAALVNTREIIRRVLVHVFSTSMSLYARKARDNKLCLALRKKAKESLKENTTAEAAIVLDAEVPATQQQLRDLIQREAGQIADAKCSALHNELAELKKSMNSRNSKNTGRGLEKNKKGASQKQKNNSGNKTKRNAKGPRERSAARSETSNISGDESDGWTSVSSRRNRRRNRRQNNRRHSQPQPPQQSQNRSRRAEGQGQDVQNDNGDNGRRRSHSRARNMSGGGNRRSNASSTRETARSKPLTDLYQTTIYPSSTAPHSHLQPCPPGCIIAVQQRWPSMILQP